MNIKEILEQHANKNNITNQQALKDMVIQIQLMCEELELDFDSALDKSTEVPELKCAHTTACPTASGAVFCPECNTCIVKGKTMQEFLTSLWRA